MFSLVAVAILSLLFSLAFTRLVRDVSVRLGLVDRPDHCRKLHGRPVPRTGGVAIAAAYVLTLAVLLHSPLAAGSVVTSNLPLVWKLLPAIGVIFATGLLDDILCLTPAWKLSGQAAAAVLAYFAGVRISAVAGHPCPEWLVFFLTAGWLVLCANAFNLIDGVDGLASGVGVLASITIFLSALIEGNLTLALVILPLAGSLTGFLRYNFNPASIFLGDCGSLLVGFLLGCCGVVWSQKSAAMLGMAAPLMAFALPLLDVGLSVVRRFLKGEPIFAADRGHIHHRLLARGFTPRSVALVLYAAGGLGAALSLLHSVLHNRLGYAVVVLFCAATWIGIQYLGYLEFVATRRFLWGGLRPMLRAHVRLEEFERSLVDARTIEDCWDTLERAAEDLGYTRISGRLGGESRRLAPAGVPGAAFWQLRLNLPDADYVEIVHRSGSAGQPILLIPFIDVIRRIVPGKLIQLGRRPGMSHSLRKLAAVVKSCESAEEAFDREGVS